MNRYVVSAFCGLCLMVGIESSKRSSLFAEPFPSICVYGHPVLRQNAAKVEKFDQNLKQTADRLLQTLRITGDGVGLAAPQVGLSQRLVVVEFRMPSVSPDFTEEQKSKITERLSGEIVQIGQDGSEKKWENITELGTFIFTNPEIEPVGTEMQDSGEGCLSLPGIAGYVSRYRKIVLKYQDLDGNRCQLKCSGFLACIIQHETDHLNGILFTDKLTDRKLLVLTDDPIWEKFDLLYQELFKKRDAGTIDVSAERFSTSDLEFALKTMEKIGGGEHIIESAQRKRK